MPTDMSHQTPSYTLYISLEEAYLKSHPYYAESVVAPSAENAGFDLITAETHLPSDSSQRPYLLSLGVKAMMVRNDTGEPVHFWLLPRSSIYKTGFMMANSVGVIDRSYRGILKGPVVQVSPAATGFAMGDRHFQIVAPDMGHISEVKQVTTFPQSQRGAGGFGSTGN